jgi:L-alanine-DL-glutamate epimerase-like enolase superfamily enzyme
MSLQVARVEAFVYRAPIAVPVQTYFGIMRDRPAVFVRVTDRHGACGWGEIWCNFPAVGAEHRARLVASVFAPLLEGQAFASPETAFESITAQTDVLAIQSAEPGPIAQCIAGIDIALWDLHARLLRQPLWRVLGGKQAHVPVYASGLNPTAPEVLAELRLADGYRAFKLKIGFGAARDLANLGALREVVGKCALMVDANQAWDFTAACEMVAQLSAFELGWLEEPLRADRPWDEWRRLRAVSDMPLAGGENLAGIPAFDAALAASALGVMQPDIAKWGGFTGGRTVAGRIVHAGLRYCPHYLGAGIGLVASAHLLAAVGGDGMLEVDANPNPLRTLTCGSLGHVVEGVARLGEEPGLGVTPDLGLLREFEVTGY